MRLFMLSLFCFFCNVVTTSVFPSAENQMSAQVVRKRNPGIQRRIWTHL